MSDLVFVSKLSQDNEIFLDAIASLDLGYERERVSLHKLHGQSVIETFRI